MRLRLRVILEVASCLALTAGLATAPGVASAQAAVPKYIYIELDPVAGNTSAALDVNNAVQAVVNVGTANRWQDGQLLDLGHLCGNCIFGAGSFGAGINDAGEIVGNTHVNSTDPPHAFVYRGGRMIDLGTGFGSGSYSLAWDINETGLIVGERSRTQSSPTRAALWQNGTIRDLGTLGGSTSDPFATESIAYAVNDRGQVVGTALPRSGNPLHGFVWQNGVMRDIGTLGGNGESTEARDIADNGQIVGRSQNAAGESHGFTSTNGVLTDLGTLGGGESGAYGVNENGQIVGYSRIADVDPFLAPHATLWVDGEIVDLNEHVIDLPADVQLQSAFDINDDGVIVGITCNAFPLCDPGKTAPPRGFLLVPVPGT
jgi:probable HAF family extracellular repeat protein